MDCKSITSVVIPSSVKKIGNSSFENCTGLTSVELPESLTQLGDRAFWGCTSATSVSLPSAITDFGKSAFEQCSKLSEIRYGDGISLIGERAFADCDNLMTLNLPSGIKTIRTEAFYDCNRLNSVSLPGTLASFGSRSFAQCTALYTLSIAEGVSYIGTEAFQDCISLKAITLPSSLLNIYGSAFSGCSNISDLQIPLGVKTIGPSAFNSCTSLKNIGFPQGLKTISASAFEGCKALNSIEIPSTVTSIGNHAFNNCTLLKTIYSYIEKPFAIADEVFTYYDESATLYVPSGTSELYWSISGWIQFSNIVELQPVVPIVVTAKSYTREYGDNNPVFEYTVTGGTLNGQPEIKCDATISSPAGEYPIVVSKGSITNDNVTFVNGTLTITKAPLTISVGDYTVLQGEECPDFEVVFEGFKNGDTRLKIQMTMVQSVSSSNAPGVYPITVSSSKSDCYEITYKNGTLTILPNYVSLGMGELADNFFEEKTSVEIQQNKANPKEFIVLKPFDGITNGPETDYIGSDTLRLVLLGKGMTLFDIPVTRDSLVYFAPVNSGFCHSYYNADVWLYHPVFFSEMDNEESWLFNRVTAFQENGLPGQVQLAPFYYMDDVGGWNVTQEDGVVVITFPGYTPSNKDVSKEAYDRLKAQVDNLKARYDEYVNRIILGDGREVLEEDDEIRAAKAAIDQQFADLYEQLRIANEEVSLDADSNIDDVLDALETAIDKLIDDIYGKTEENTHNAQRYAQLNRDLNDLQEELDDAKEAIEALPNVGGLYEDEIQGLQDRLDTMRDELETANTNHELDLATELDDYKPLKKDIADLVKAAQDEEAAYNDNKANLEDAVQGLKDALEQLQADRDKLVNDNEFIDDDDVADIDQQIADLDQAIKDIEDALAQADDDKKLTDQDTLDELNKAIEDANKAAEAGEKAVEDQQADYDLHHIKGDVNNDTKVNVSDVTYMVNQLNSPATLPTKEDDPEQFARLNVNGDQRINVADLTAVINLVLNADNAREVAFVGEESLSVNGTMANGMQQLSLDMNSARKYTAYQADIVLPAGTTLAGAELTARANNHVLDVMELGNNTYRVMVYSATNATFKGEEGAVLNLQLNGNGQAQFENIVFADRNAVAHDFTVAGAQTTGISGVKGETGVKDAIYNMGGRVMNAPRKGINIVDGRKILVK